jgi:hypothetical protein
MKLPRIIAFDDSAYPELGAIFRDIELGMAALVAAEMDGRRPLPDTRRRRAAKAAPKTSTPLRRRTRRAAA